MKPRVRLTVAAVMLTGALVALLVSRYAFASGGGTASGNDLSGGSGISLGSAGGPAAELNSLAPDFTLLQLDGTPVTLSSLRGKVVLVNFWASWCVPCRREMPDINAAFLARQDRGFTVLAVNLKEGREPAQGFAEKYGLSFPVLLDSKGDVAKAYRVAGLPESWLVDESGILRDRKIGPFTREDLEKTLDSQMSRTATASK